MIQAVIFDCFGVLAHDGWLPFRDRHFRDNLEKLTEATDLNKRSNAGFVDYDDFLQQIAEMAGIATEQARREIEDNPVDTTLMTFIRELKPRYKIGMLSNASDYHLATILTDEQLGLFDEIVLSYQVGAVKPEAIMYQTVAAKLGVGPETCLFIDDQERYVTGAREAGMQSIQFVDTQATIAAIKGLVDA